MLRLRKIRDFYQKFIFREKNFCNLERMIINIHQVIYKNSSGREVLMRLLELVLVKRIYEFSEYDETTALHE